MTAPIMPDRGDLPELLDLMRDEFRRIRMLAPRNEEIHGICGRAIASIAQRVPVIQQRDALEQELARTKQALQEAEDRWHRADTQDTDIRQEVHDAPRSHGNETDARRD